MSETDPTEIRLLHASQDGEIYMKGSTFDFTVETNANANVILYDADNKGIINVDKSTHTGDVKLGPTANCTVTAVGGKFSGDGTKFAAKVTPNSSTGNVAEGASSLAGIPSATGNKQMPTATELRDEGIQTDTTEVQTNDKFQQTDDFRSQMLKELPHAIGCPSTTSKVIGPKGGMIALHGYKVSYPPDSLKEKKEIELSIDANPSNFPEEGLPVTSILNIKPSMKLEIPATVSMPTSCRAASGKVEVQIWSKEFDEDWKKSQKVSLATINRITFETFHFSDLVATSVPGNEDNTEHIIKNRMFIQRDTATFSSVFWQVDEHMQETKKRYKEMKYAGARPTDIILEGKLNTEFKLMLKSTSPDLQYTSNGQNSVIFKLKSKFLKARCPISIEFHITEDIPERTRNMKMTYSVIVNGELDEECPLSVPWPIEINHEGPSSASPDVQVNVKKEITGYKAESGGTIQASNGKIDTQISG